MDKLMKLVGFTNDDKKSGDDCSEMMGLGHWVLVSLNSGCVETRLDQEKAVRWLEDLKEMMMTGKCPPAFAGKFAGRFSWAVTMQNDKIGRAYIREWYMATNDPLPGWNSEALAPTKLQVVDGIPRGPTKCNSLDKSTGKASRHHVN